MKRSKIQNMKKNKSSVFNGLIIGLGVGILVLLVSIFGSLIIESEIILGLFRGLMYPAVYVIELIINNWCHNSVGCLILIIPLYLFPILFYGILGLLIGLIIDLIRSKIKK